MMIYNTTLGNIANHKPCVSGFNKLVRHLQGNAMIDADYCLDHYITDLHEKEINLSEVIKSNGIFDALWSMRCVTGFERDARLFGVYFARKIHDGHIDEVSRLALRIAELYAEGNASDDELDDCRLYAYQHLGRVNYVTNCGAYRTIRAAAGTLTKNASDSSIDAIKNSQCPLYPPGLFGAREYREKHRIEQQNTLSMILTGKITFEKGRTCLTHFHV